VQALTGRTNGVGELRHHREERRVARRDQNPRQLDTTELMGCNQTE
jgi:hypothetical protein